jgi:hypothetical protein
MRAKFIQILFIASMTLSLGQVSATQADTGGPHENLNDAFVAPDVSIDTMRFAAATSSSITPGFLQTSEYMAGSVAVGIVLVQSDGNLDPSTESWTPEEKQLVYNKIVAASNWWAQMEARAHLRFVYDDQYTHPLPTGVEPITRPYSDQRIWIADAMSALGYNAPSYFTSVRGYDNYLRATYHTDWAFTIFVVDSSNDSDGHFSDGYFAYAYLGGPFMVMSYTNSGYGPDNMDAVAAHEMGHIFNALDQYYSAAQPCAGRSGYLFVENQNSQYGSCALNVSSIMRGQTWPYAGKAIDPYAAGQIGWRDSDSDGILDPLDTDLPISIAAVSLVNNSVVVSGTAEIVPYPSPSRPSVTINRLTSVRYRFDQGDWQAALAHGDAFGGTAGDYDFVAPVFPGRHILQVAAEDSAGNVSAIYATQTITVLDAIDGGLITQLDPPSRAFAHEAIAVPGKAYELQDGVITKVEYRINGGAWQPAQAQDGAFDSADEDFVAPLSSLAVGTYLIEARATDSNGKTEIDVASQQVTVTQQLYTVFLPAIVR